MFINGSVFFKGGLINLDMYFGLVWIGFFFSDNVNGGKLDVVMNNSVWNVISNFNFDMLVLSYLTVDFVSYGLIVGIFVILNVENLSGNSIFIMCVDVVGEGNGVNNKGDLLNISGSSVGNYVLVICNQGSEVIMGNEVLIVVKIIDGVVLFSVFFQVELGGYLYDVCKNGINWEFYVFGIVLELIFNFEFILVFAQFFIVNFDFMFEFVFMFKFIMIVDVGGNYFNVGYLLNYVENCMLM